MRITSDQRIAGYPTFELRKFVRRHRFTCFLPEQAADALALSPEAAADLLSKLLSSGNKEAGKFDEGQLFQLTNYGHDLANATGARQICRKTAERVLTDFLERVRKVNATSQYLYRVQDVILFGSMLSDAERLGDVDVAVNLAPKVSRSARFQERHAARIRAAQLEGRCFHTILERAYWPINEVYLQLKAKSRYLSLHELAQIKHLPNLSYRVLLGVPEQLGGLIPTGRAV
ncbi:MAG: hypothetical protein WAL75_13715 [Terracidiphilus sp.]